MPRIDLYFARARMTARPSQSIPGMYFIWAYKGRPSSKYSNYHSLGRLFICIQWTSLALKIYYFASYSLAYTMSKCGAGFFFFFVICCY